MLSVYPSAVVVRTSLMYGLDEMDRGTAGFAERLGRGESLTLFSDVQRNPVQVDALADALVALCAIEYAGLLNVAGGIELDPALGATRLPSLSRDYLGSPDRDKRVRSNGLGGGAPPRRGLCA